RNQTNNECSPFSSHLISPLLVLYYPQYVLNTTMDISLANHDLLAISGLLMITIFVYYRQRYTGTQQPPLPPEPSGGLPIIGHLLQLVSSKKPLAIAFADMADRHGPIFTIRLGIYRAVVVNDPKTVQECFTTHDRVLASRPKSSQAEYLNYNYAGFGSSPYGSYWRDIRKLAVTQLLSGQRLKSLQHVQISEINMFVKGLHDRIFNKSSSSSNNNNGAVVVVMSEMLEQLSANMITRLIAGKRYFDYKDDAGDNIGELIKSFMRVCGEFVPSDLVPCVGWMNWFGGPLKSMKMIGKELDDVMQSWIDEHKLKKKKKQSDELGGQSDFIDVMLSAIEDDFAHQYSPETIIKATALTLILAGADTTSITMTWILSNLLNNSRAMEAVQQELDNKVGRSRPVEYSDINNLVYLQAIVKETLRLYPPAPTAVPHEAMENCTIHGYHVPKGTRVFANLWKLHRDPNVWSDPDQFKPERFLDNDSGSIDLSGKNFELIPFGSGRRSCPGAAFALQVVNLTVARLLQGFDITSHQLPVDMVEGLGLTMPKAAPLKVLLLPRLPLQLYNV
ncbi:Cytochrome P450 CYP82J17, partial [Linum grandiflorum]